MNHPAHHGPTVTPKRRHPDSTGAAPVGIVIATRNRRASLAVTVRNLLALPERPDVLVVDNASTDDTRAMLARDFPQVRVLPLPYNRGALARTHGVRALDTPYVAFSDDDSWWAPGALGAAARHFDDHPGSACSPPAPSSAPATPPTPSTTCSPTPPRHGHRPPRHPGARLPRLRRRRPPHRLPGRGRLPPAALLRR